MSLPHRLLRAGGGARLVDAGELWNYRDLLRLLVRRDLVARYRPTLLGPIWAFLQPVAATAVFSTFLGGLVGIPSDGAPYAAFVLLGLLPWSLFVAGVSRAAASLVVNGPLLGKAYFPRAYLPISAVTTAVLDLALSIPALGIVLVATGVGLRPGLLICVVPLSIAAFLAFGLGLLLAALTVRYRDVLQALPFILQLAMFATPVVYPASLIPERHRALLLLNPMAAVVEGTRDCALGRAFATGPMVAAIFVGLALLAVGLVAFQAAERVAADGL